MLKILPVAFVAATVFVASTNYPNASLAETCASQCGIRPIQFTPGQRIRLQVVNTTSNLVKLEKLQETKPIPLQAGEKFQLDNEQQSNISLVFWDEKGLPLKAIFSKPNAGTLRVELGRGKVNPGDRSLDILSDGRVKVY
ncbi:hypothetical protein [Calothrix sp. PCC 7507]|uniref:hypothetical protein n=1 Tax=Calothrix sp. PCC 7507 TaxID=99598 RepID=UPI00029EF911|nr:hypothetical protein [Calothrix sp. PCC 7507]AFY30846.1 hypothetical protein Cal7507_0350 [Calothrix sp. PCC 7507]